MIVKKEEPEASHSLTVYQTELDALHERLFDLVDANEELWPPSQVEQSLLLDSTLHLRAFSG